MELEEMLLCISNCNVLNTCRGARISKNCRTIHFSESFPPAFHPVFRGRLRGVVMLQAPVALDLVEREPPALPEARVPSSTQTR